MRHLPSLTRLVLLPLAASSSGVDYHKLPTDPVFPGPWDQYIKAPANKSFITPARFWKVEGNVTTPSVGLGLRGLEHSYDRGVLIGEGGLLTVEFEENIGGRVCFEVVSVRDEPILNLAYSESPSFAGRQSDATNEDEWDLPLPFHLGNRTGPLCVGPEFNRGAFKYLTLYIDDIPVLEALGRPDSGAAAEQEVLGLGRSSPHVSGERQPYSKPSVGIAQIWVNCTSFPSQKNGRAYTGYFYSSSDLLNRIWYAGAYTLQLSTIDPSEGSALIPVNRYIDHNMSPPGSWYSNFTVAKGTVVTTDGAKRDRLVWPGDMYIAIPGIAVSSYDMLAVRNALNVVYEHQYDDGSLPYAGPPLGYRGEFSDTYHLHTLLGTYDYVLYSGDIAWLRKRWPAYQRALRVSVAKVDKRYNLMHVSSPLDWNRHGMQGHNIEASAILHMVLTRSVELASWLYDNGYDAQAKEEEWVHVARTLELGIRQLYCDDTGLYSDNLSDRRCSARGRVEPQDGNSWALIAKMHGRGSTVPARVSRALRARWNAFGAPAPEFPNVMSPFASAFELQAHGAAGDADAAVELMLLMWGHLLNGEGFTNSTLAEGFRVDGDPHYPAYPVPSRNSHAHGWAAGPTAALFRDVLGVRLLGPGGETWRVQPALTKWLGWTRGGFAVGRGDLEVMLWRVVRVAEGSATATKGVIAVVRGPEGTRGRFSWGGLRGDGGDGNDFVVEMGGGQTRAWVRLESGNGSDERFVTEELDVPDRIWELREGGETWYKQRIPYGADEALVYDDSFQAPVMEERGPGVVNWKALTEGYIDTRSRW
ncbi:Six-hairpin glycosidase-like protein [Durotheca rogersii]|uniref:Six-hairpin glycosidase-like protein n=1 Tax=Durotheca rogersii TaxID=419775 RepID=UPI002220AE0E|nr:Six-hairpin glycosidase-like protein [Durotheca rogersii]KAI5862933.1 Six-hairpin glycosidase-like protein [Durotheca rogersii]